MYQLGIDIGGTDIKAGITDQSGRLLSSRSRPTALPRGADEVAEDACSLCLCLLGETGIAVADIGHIGVGCPGSVDSNAGIVRYANNLNWRNADLKACISAKLPGIPVSIANDANAAAFGECVAGSAQNASSVVVITLGTGVGSGVILDSKIMCGHNSAASEIGHMVIAQDGWPCTCGRRGCFEAYSSATGLIRMTREAMDQNPRSALWQAAQAEGRVSGKTAFAAAKTGDVCAAEVVDNYISYLACGLSNVINIFQPELLCLGGGLSKEGAALFDPLRKAVGPQIYGGAAHCRTEIRQCALGGDAGIIGASLLYRGTSRFGGK